jgi:uncharacterized protein YegL
MKIKISTVLLLNILIPIFVGSFVIICVTLIPINNSKKDWTDKTNTFVAGADLNSNLVSINYISKYIETYFNRTKNDIITIEQYIKKSLNNEFKIVQNYDTYYGVSSIDNRTPLSDAYGYPFFSSTFQKDLKFINQTDPYEYKESSIYDNVMRSVYKSSGIYSGIYFAFEKDGFYRYYPYTSFDSYQFLEIVCDNNQTIIGYDPRCRNWYINAKMSDDIYYSSPYNDALTNKLMITSSKRIMNGSSLIGIIGMDYSMEELDNIIINNIPLTKGYSFMMDTNGLLISYPTLNRNSLSSQTIFEIESKISIQTWNNILSDINMITPKFLSVNTSNETWTIVYNYIPEQEYFVVILYPSSSIYNSTENIFINVNNSVMIGTIVMSIMSAIILLTSGIVIFVIGRKYTMAINELTDNIKKIGDVNLDIEMGNKSHVSAEFSKTNEHFGNLYLAVKMGNESYFNGNLSKALDAYKKGTELMMTMNQKRGLSVCYNNQANVFKQMQNNIEAEKMYLESLKIVEDLLNQEKDQNKKIAWKIMISYRKMNLGVLYKDINKLQLAKNFLEEGLVLARETDNILGISKISGNLGQLYLQMNNIPEGERILLETYDNLLQKGDDVDDISIQYALMNIGLLYSFKQEYKKAGYFFTKILKTYKELDAYVKKISLYNVYFILKTLNYETEANKIKDEADFHNEKMDDPKNILFVLDISGSMNGSRLNQCKKSIKDIITNYLSKDDKVSFYAFNNIVHTIFENYSLINLTEMLISINNVKADGGTAFYDALKTAIDKGDLKENKNNSKKKNDNIPLNKNNNRWIIALTDGENNQGQYDQTHVIKSLEKITTNLIIITVGTLNNKAEINHICDMANKKSFGKLIESSVNIGDIEVVFKKAIDLVMGQLHVDDL